MYRLVARAPHAIAAFVRRRVGLLLALSTSIALVLVLSQQPFPDGIFEYGEIRSYRGTIHEGPVPSIDLADGRTALLVAPGKHGASTLLNGFDVRMADLRATRIERGGILMLEIEPGSIRAEGMARRAPGAWNSSGAVQLTGEIVDSKCYLGVMKPGEGRVHRACAIRCISGGIPPALVAFDAHGARRMIVLTGRNGAPIGRELLDVVGEPVSVRGELFHAGDRLRLEIEPHDVRRLESTAGAVGC